jgi:GNAT superfamily N-acetyltransferase
MTPIEIHPGDAPELEAFLVQRVYEYNAAATGYHDGETFTASHRGESGEIEAGTSGYTWGGCCYVANLWVTEALRGKGLGSELLRAVERYAREKNCRVVFLSTHSLQAPGFYERHGYTPIARIEDQPLGHASIFYAKRLDTAPE